MTRFFFFFGRLLGIPSAEVVPKDLFLFLVGGFRTFSFDVGLIGVIPTKFLPGLVSVMSACPNCTLTVTGLLAWFWVSTLRFGGRLTCLSGSLGTLLELLPLPSRDLPLAVGPLGSSSVEVAFGVKDSIGIGLGSLW